MKKYIESFFLGILAALGSLVVIEAITTLIQLFSTNKQQTSSFDLSIYIPIFLTFSAFSEEFFKYLIIKKKLSVSFRNYKLPIASIFLGLGFASVEILFFYSNSLLISENLSSIAQISALHIITSALIGHLVLFSFLKKLDPINTLILSIVPSFSVHLIYNFFELENIGFQSKIVLLLAFILILFSRFLINKMPKNIDLP